jgi:hypothetical protein
MFGLAFKLTKPEEGFCSLAQEPSDEESDEGLPADLVKAIGLREAKKDTAAKLTPEQKQEQQQKQIQAKMEKAKETFDKRVDLWPSALPFTA